MRHCRGWLFTVLFLFMPWVLEVVRHFAVLYIPVDDPRVRIREWIRSDWFGPQLRFTNLQAMNASFSAVVVIAFLNVFHAIQSHGNLAVMFRVKLQITASHHWKRSKVRKRRTPQSFSRTMVHPATNLRISSSADWDLATSPRTRQPSLEDEPGGNVVAEVAGGAATANDDIRTHITLRTGCTRATGTTG